MPLDPQAQAMRDRAHAAGVAPLYTLSIEEARAADLAAIQAAAGTGEPVHEVINLDIPGPAGPLPIRIYRPSAAEQLPTLVYFFGGGWTLGNLDTSDAICRALANAVPCQVIAVGYRLAPEHKFPAAVNDCYEATRWIAAHVAPSPIAVAGDSAGGNLAAVVTLMARDNGTPPIAAQVLIYPNTDYRGNTDSMRENDDLALFNHHSVSWYWDHYLSAPADGFNPLASPLLAPDLAALPPTLVITAEYDPLRDEGETYAAHLRASGVPVESTRYSGMPHGFVAMSGILDAGRQALSQVASYLSHTFSSTVG